MEIKIITNDHHHDNVDHDKHVDLNLSDDDLNINSDQDYLCTIINTSNKICIQFTMTAAAARL